MASRPSRPAMAATPWGKCLPQSTRTSDLAFLRGRPTILMDTLSSSTRYPMVEPATRDSVSPEYAPRGARF